MYRIVKQRNMRYYHEMTMNECWHDNVISLSLVSHITIGSNYQRLKSTSRKVNYQIDIEYKLITD